MFLKSVTLRVVATMIALVMLLAVGFSKAEPYDVRDPENCRLHFSVLSDAHIEGNNFMRYKVFARSVQNVKKNQSGNAAIVFLGDNTMNGQHIENMLFHGTVSLLLRGETVLPVMGNHDIGNGEGDYEKLQNRWYDYTEAFFGKKLEHPYYYEVIDGYYFIVLGMEGHEVHDLVMTETQFTWLENVLAKAAKSGKPAFVFAHQPTDYATDEDRNETGRLVDMLAAYNETNDLFCFVGHTHMPLYLFWSFHTEDGYPETYLPRLTSLGGEKDNEVNDNTGVGIEVELYDGEIVIRGRDFYRSEWKYDDYDEAMCEVTYPLKNALTVAS